MIAGKLDRRVSILRRAAPVDDGYTSDPGTGELQVYATRWASWRPVTLREQFEFQGVEGRAEGKFWLRSDSLTRHIANTDKVAFDGLIYDVLGVSSIGRREGVELLCTAADGQVEMDLSGLSPVPDAATTFSGWAAYMHTGATQTLAANTKVSLVNNAGSIIDSQKPADVAQLYDGTVITGRTGDAIMAGIEFTFTPNNSQATGLIVSIDVDGAIGEIYVEEYPIIKGVNMPHKVSYHPPAYTLDTWQTHGGTVKVVADGPGVVSAVRYVIHRIHKAR